jgi:NAD(P)-dependent dehydrogenase (short-subunit alcohol dehydrogenase family)
MKKRPRVVVITGGTRGLGRALAEAFLGTGDHVWCLARGRAGRPPHGAHFIPTDILKASAVTDVTRREKRAAKPTPAFPVDLATAAAEVRVRAGKIDIWINNAGGGSPVPFADPDDAAWRAVFDLNFHGVVNGCRAAVPMLRGRGSVVINLASLAGLMAPAGHSAYTSAKAAVIALTRSLAVEYAAAGIRFNAVAPGPLDTPGFRAAGGNPAARARSIPTRRLVRPAEVVSACRWLCEPNASVTGEVIVLDGAAAAAGCYA